MTDIIPYVLVMFCVCALAAGQIIFKIVSGRISTLIDIFRDPGTLTIFAAAAVLYALSTLAWISALKSLPLSQAYLFMSFGFLLVPIAAHFVFGEALSSPPCHRCRMCMCWCLDRGHLTGYSSTSMLYKI